MDVKYFVRTTNERKFDYNIPYEKIVDTKNMGVLAYIDALMQVDKFNVVLMEDDLVLCDNFKQEIEQVIAQYPRTIINFFTAPNTYFTTHLSVIFDYNQCTYFPQGLTKLLAKEMIKRYNPKHCRSYGALLNTVLHDLGLYHLIYRPFLVQHIDGNSTFHRGNFRTRNTIWFKDYLDRLGITMEEAYNLRNRDKLTAMLEEDRIKWYGENYKERFMIR